jgi:endonuclease I
MSTSVSANYNNLLQQFCELKTSDNIQYKHYRYFLSQIARHIYSALSKNEFNSKVNDGTLDVNIEHIVPRELYDANSYVSNDLYQLFLSPKNVNAYRSSFMYGENFWPTFIFSPYGKSVIFKNSIPYAYLDCETKPDSNTNRQIPANLRVKNKFKYKYECGNIDTSHSNTNRNMVLDSNNIVLIPNINNNRNVKKINDAIDTPSRLQNKFVSQDDIILDKDTYTYYTNFGINSVTKSTGQSYYTCHPKKPTDCLIEPTNKDKGVISRVILYIYTFYMTNINADINTNNESYCKYFTPIIRSKTLALNFFSEKNMKMFKKWNKNFPPTADEILDTLYISNITYYLNPFVLYYDINTNSYCHNPQLYNMIFSANKINIDIASPELTNYYSINTIIKDFTFVNTTDKTTDIITLFVKNNTSTNTFYANKYKKYKKKYLEEKKKYLTN